MPYYNFKYVAIPDSLLTRLHKGLMCAIACYVCVVLVVLNKGYLSFDGVIGTMQFRVAKMHAKPETAFPYCIPAPDGTAPPKVHCANWDEFDVRYPLEGDARTLFVTTAVELSHQWRERDGRPFITQNKTHWRVAGAEEYWVFASHTMQAPRHFADARSAEERKEFAHSEKSMRGVLLDTAGDVVAEFTQPKEDVLKITDLLRAAGGVDLDAPSDRVVRGRLTEPFNAFRDRGLALFVSIAYENSRDSWFGTTPVRYVYRVQHIHESEASTLEPDYTLDALPSQQHRPGKRSIPPIADDPQTPGPNDAPLPPPAPNEPLRPHKAVEPLPAHLKLQTAASGHAERWLRDRRGLRITFAQTGSIARFSVQQLLTVVVSGMGLLAAAATIVESLLFYVLPGRQQYIDAVIETATLPGSPAAAAVAANAAATPAAAAAGAVAAAAVAAGAATAAAAPAAKSKSKAAKKNA